MQSTEYRQGRELNIPWDNTDTMDLVITTDSPGNDSRPNSGQAETVAITSKDNSIWIMFSEGKIVYHLGNCDDEQFITIDEQLLPDDVEKTWRIEFNKSDHRLQIYCNETKVANKVCDSWDEITVITFNSDHDSASDSYCFESKGCTGPDPTWTDSHLQPADSASFPKYPGAQVTLACVTGYTLDGSDTVTCVRGIEYTSTPDGPHATCTQKQCTGLHASWTHVIKEDTTEFPVNYGSHITVLCDPGYELGGQSQVTCDQGTTFTVPLGTKSPTCTQLECTSLPTTAAWAGITTAATNLPKNYAETLQVSCTADHKFSGSSTITCTGDTTYTWGQEGDPTCTPTCSGLPHWPEISVVGDVEFPVEEGTAISVECSERYTLVGEGRVTCLQGEDFGTNIPSCEIKTISIGSRNYGGSPTEEPESKADQDMCHDVQETGSKLHPDQEVYIYGIEGQPYNWPMTPKLGNASIPCHYNTEESATKKCKENLEFEATNFEKCKTKVTNEIGEILDKANSIQDDDDRETIARYTKDLIERNSPVMNNDNVDTTAAIIVKLIDSTTEDQELSESVRDNILSTVDYVHLETRKEEIAKGTTAKKIRGSVSKVINKLAASSTSSYLTRPSIGVSVSLPRAGATSFAITGNPADISLTERREGEPGRDEDVIFEVSVPADTGSSVGVTAALYTTDKFYPDPVLVSDPTNSLAEVFLGNPTNTNPTKVVSMVTDISYAGTEKRKTFPEGDVITLSYYLEKPEEPRVHYKMPLMTEYKCAYYKYNTDQNSWVGSTDSGCVKEEVDVGDDRKKVTCRCNHMTSFAVLMSFGSDYDQVEEVVSYALLAISLGCLLCTLIAYLPAKEMLKTRTVRLNLLLVTSMICSIIVFYFMEVVVARDISEGSVKRESDSASIQCVLIAFLMNYFWMCQMAWMVCEAVVMYRALVSCVMNSHIHRYMLKFNLACWGIPLIFPIAGVIWGQDQYANPRTCFLRPLYGFVTFYAPVVMAVLFNIFIFLRVGWSISRNENMGTKVPVSDLDRRKKQFKFAVTVMSLLGVAWVFGFFLIIEQFNQIWLRYLFILTNSTQGIFIFILYVVLNDNLKKVWKKLVFRKETSPPTPVYHTLTMSKMAPQFNLN